MHTKAEAFGSYKAFEAWALAQQLCAAIKVLRLDRGGEYLSGAFDQHLACHGSAGTPLRTHAGGEALGLQDARTAIRT
jgi:transposase InsO family protein